jgi:hypothetical protein
MNSHSQHVTALDLQAALQAIYADGGPQLDGLRRTIGQQFIYVGTLLSEPSVPQTRQEPASA